jgi:hypothetical protein
MATKLSERAGRASQLSSAPDGVDAPPPSAVSAGDGMEAGRAIARQYMVDAVYFLARVAFGVDSDAALHTRVIAAKELISIAGVPQPTPAIPVPSLPPHEDDRCGNA